MADQRLEKYNFLGLVFEAFSLTGAIICILASFIFCGIWLTSQGNPMGEKIWSTFGSAFTAFITGKKLGESDALKSFINKQDNNGQQ